MLYMYVGTFPVVDMATLEQVSAMAAGGEEFGKLSTASCQGNARDGHPWRKLELMRVWAGGFGTVDLTSFGCPRHLAPGHTWWAFYRGRALPHAKQRQEMASPWENSRECANDLED